MVHTTLYIKHKGEYASLDIYIRVHYACGAPEEIDFRAHIILCMEFWTGIEERRRECVYSPLSDGVCRYDSLFATGESTHTHMWLNEVNGAERRR